MNVQVECLDGVGTFFCHWKACEWLTSLGYVPLETYRDGWPLCLARIFSDAGIAYWMKKA